MNPILKSLITPMLPLHWQCAGLLERVRMSREIHQALPMARPTASARIKVAFVSSWFGKGISGGAESECFGLVEGLHQRGSVDVEVITTTLKEFSADWNAPYHQSGSRLEHGVRVHRFDPSMPDRRSFHVLNGSRLMEGGTVGLKRCGNASPVPKNIEAFYLKHMIHSPSLLAYLREHYNDYDLFIYIPYMFAPTALGGLLTKEKSVVIPCLHDERYAFMDIYKALMTSVRASIFHVPAELRLAKQIYGPSLAAPYLLGEAVHTEAALGDPSRFRAKFKLSEPFILYAGRVITGKNVPEMVERFLAYKARWPGPLKLVLIGKGDLSYANCEDIIELGFVDEQDKLDAYRAAEALCQPSLNESFSIVMMEAWLQETPVLVHANCEVTKDHIDASEGGLVFADQDSFDAAMEMILHNPEMKSAWGLKGRHYVRTNYSPDIILERFEGILRNLTGKH